MFSLQCVSSTFKTHVKRFSLRKFASYNGSPPEKIRNIAWLNSDDNGILTKLFKRKSDKQSFQTSETPFGRTAFHRHGGFDLNILIPEGLLFFHEVLLVSDSHIYIWPQTERQTGRGVYLLLKTDPTIWFQKAIWRRILRSLSWMEQFYGLVQGEVISQTCGENCRWSLPLRNPPSSLLTSRIW